MIAVKVLFLKAQFTYSDGFETHRYEMPKSSIANYSLLTTHYSPQKRYLCSNVVREIKAE